MSSLDMPIHVRQGSQSDLDNYTLDTGELGFAKDADVSMHGRYPTANLVEGNIMPALNRVSAASIQEFCCAYKLIINRKTYGNTYRKL